uniref:Uncharacterized protein n=1 Tax=Physcomitrium patens TaxID=3218 RepID=A0A2K1ISV3_PHYPA|nr:hypothetical protein PHYPA_026485 [Physcomitrium patens]
MRTIRGRTLQERGGRLEEFTRCTPIVYRMEPRIRLRSLGISIVSCTLCGGASPCFFSGISTRSDHPQCRIGKRSGRLGQCQIVASCSILMAREKQETFGVSFLLDNPDA